MGVVQGELEGAAEIEANIDFGTSVDVNDVDVNLQMHNLADTPDTPDPTATLVGDNDADNNEDDEDASGKVVLGGGVSTAVGSQAASMVVRSHPNEEEEVAENVPDKHANNESISKSQTQREE